MYLRSTYTLFLLGLSLSMIGCVTIIEPQKPWFEPVKLGLDDSALQDATIELECGYGSMDSKDWTPQDTRSCRQIAKLLEEFGADVILPADQNLPSARGREIQRTDKSKNFEDEVENGKLSVENEPTELDFSVVYIEKGVKSDHFLVLSNLPCIPFFWFWPCIETGSSHAELLFYDRDGILRETFPLKVKFRQLIGPTALYIYVARITDKNLKNFYRKEVPERLNHYILNLVNTFNVRRRLNDRKIGATKRVVGVYGD